MKIVLVTPYFPPNVGGIETYVYELAKRLSKENTIYVFTCGRGVTEKYDGVKVFRLKAIDIQNLPFSLKIPYPIPLSLVFKLAKYDVDIIHVHGHAFITSFEAAVASRLVHKPLILTIHDIGVAYQDYLIMRGIRPIYDSIFVTCLFKYANVVIAQNDATYKYSLKFKPKRITIIPQGVDLELFKPIEDEGEYITFIAARLVPQKGGKIFIHSVPSILKKVKDARFMIIGEGFQRHELEGLARELGVSEYIEFIGRVPHTEVPKYLGNARLVVFPSEIPTGLTLIEAAAMKRPIITTKNGWAKETLGDIPLYIPMRDSDALSRAVIHLWRNPL